MWESPIRPYKPTVAQVEYNQLVLQAAACGDPHYALNSTTIRILQRVNKSRADFFIDVGIARHSPQWFASPAAGVILTPEARAEIRAMREEVTRLQAEVLRLQITEMQAELTTQRQAAQASGESTAEPAVGQQEGEDTKADLAIV